MVQAPGDHRDRDGSTNRRASGCSARLTPPSQIPGSPVARSRCTGGFRRRDKRPVCKGGMIAVILDSLVVCGFGDPAETVPRVILERAAARYASNAGDLREHRAPVRHHRLRGAGYGGLSGNATGSRGSKVHRAARFRDYLKRMAQQARGLRLCRTRAPQRISPKGPELRHAPQRVR